MDTLLIIKCHCDGILTYMICLKSVECIIALIESHAFHIHKIIISIMGVFHWYIISFVYLPVLMNWSIPDFDGLVQERCNSIANALELHTFNSQKTLISWASYGCLLHFGSDCFFTAWNRTIYPSEYIVIYCSCKFSYQLCNLGCIPIHYCLNACQVPCWSIDNDEVFSSQRNGAAYANILCIEKTSV